ALLSLVQDAPGDKRIEEYLLEERKRQVRLIQQIRDFERKLDQYGMEYLMMQRYPVPHESEACVVDTLRFLDTVIEEIMMIRENG
ncbi:hypothetical protein, partial [Pseudomonas juntendi]|uniref:hypothetical protein n=1 Tax=Pseudomonas juntendi TaxID=2666183 RepID=UPI00211833EB